MKTTLAIVCSLVLAWTQVVLAQAPAASVERAAPACCRCGQACGCAARHSPEQQPVPAAPAPSSSQSQPLIPAPVAWAWSLPDTATPGLATSFHAPPLSAGLPLFARDCALLI